MVIKLYECSSDKETLDKSLSEELSLSGTLREASSVINPTFTIEHTNPTDYNYCYVPEFGRYYYIKDIVSVRNGLWKIICSVDVLMSFKTDILNMGIILDETENASMETYMSGDAWQRLVKTKTDIINFPYGLNSTGEYILVTSGGLPTGSGSE